MFTGIVEAIGEVVAVAPTAGGHRLCIETRLAGELKAGDSLAVNGVCLTIVHGNGVEVQADVGPETARVTNLSRLVAGGAVNLERPVRLDARLDGHLVLGHVDALGHVERLDGDGDSHWLRVRFPPTLASYFIPKGSVAVDGVSLTVARLEDHQFDVQIVPYTWQHTTFHRLKAGDTVNLECDMIGKYVVRALETLSRTSPRDTECPEENHPETRRFPGTTGG